MSASPDLVEPVLGFRAWHVDRFGGLVPVAFQACTWERGVNRAECHADGHRARHDAPQPDCKCGLYAFHSVDALPGRRPDVCIGAVAAWGNLELHATGFRAEFACVVALSGGPLSRRLMPRLEEAGERYGVPVVERDDLLAAGLEHARPIAPVTPRWRGGGSPPFEAYGISRHHWKGASLPHHLHYDPHAHTWAKLDGDTALVGLAAPARRLLSFTPSFRDWAVGSVERGGLLGTASGRGGGQVKILAPIGGDLVRFNPLLDWAPHVLRTSPYEQGWVARIKPSAWDWESVGLLTGADGVAAYLSQLNRNCQGPSEIFMPLATWRRDPILLPSREPQPEPDESAEHQRTVARFLDECVGRDRDLARLLGTAGVRLRVEVGRPPTSVEIGNQGPRRLVVKASAATAHALFLGRIDPPRALALGRIELAGDRELYGAVMSVLKRVFPRYRAWVAER